MAVYGHKLIRKKRIILAGDLDAVDQIEMARQISVLAQRILGGRGPLPGSDGPKTAQLICLVGQISSR
jgi:hypothetical protein